MTIRVAITCAAEVEAALRQSLQRDGDIAVTARVPATRTARVSPEADVLVVDVESAGAGTLDFIAQVMSMTPLPILALCPPDGAAPTAIQVLLHGAVESIPRSAYIDSGGRLLRQSVHMVNGVSVVRRNRPGREVARSRPAPSSLVAIAASTGGPAALAEVLGRLARLPVPVLVVQHLHDAFVASFITWLGGYSALPVSQAMPGQTTRPGHVYVAPAGQHLRLARDRTLLLSESPASVHRPSADVLFSSVAVAAGPSGIGVMLTGMGEDGAAGLLAMRHAGALTVVQDEASCAVFGMPRAALDIGAADRALPLEGIAEVILTATGRVTA